MTLIALHPGGPEIARLASTIAAAAGRAARRHRLEVALFSGLGAMLGVIYLVLAIAPPAERTAAAPAPAPAWVETAKPLPVYSFAAPEFAHAVASYGMRRHSTGGGREDVLTFGVFTGADAYLRIVVHRVGGEGAPNQTLFVESARRAAEAGLALDGLGRATAVLTRFGQAEWAEARIAAPGQAAAREGCAVFRFAADEPALQVFGAACGPDGVAFTRRQMACLIGGLDLAAASDDDELQRYFARSELARDAACSGPRPHAAAAPTRPKPVAHAAMRR